jgi:D-inositol-3-phosphate glycosyltransferase
MAERTPLPSPPSPGKLRVVLAGTHPQQFNGYSKVVYELARRLAREPDLEVHVFGFQNMNPGAAPHRDLPPSVLVYDAMANEQPAKQGFGIDQVNEYCRRVRPDVFVVYNDMIVVSAMLEQLAEARRERGFRVVAYVDQVYEHQKRAFVEALNANADACVAFTPYWEGVLRAEGVRGPMHHLQHGFDPDTYHPVPRGLARRYFGIPGEDFVVLNLNRNQPRKRWDVCLKAWAHLVSVRGESARGAGAKPFKLVVGTAVNGAWNLLEVYERELKKRGVTLEEGMKHLIFINSPQKLTDFQVNVLMNAADVGLNTCDGEGFGLCTFEHAGIGVPQVAPAVGGFTDYLDSESATLVDPVLNYYVDNSRDKVGGEAQVCDYGDFADALEAYMDGPELAARHGAEARKRLLSGKYSWDALAAKLAGILREAAGAAGTAAQDAPAPPAGTAPAPPSPDAGRGTLVAEAEVGTAPPARAADAPPARREQEPLKGAAPPASSDESPETPPAPEETPEQIRKKLQDMMAEIDRLRTILHA